LVYNKVDRLLPEEKAIIESTGQTLAISALDRKTILPVLTAMEDALWREGHDVRTVGPSFDAVPVEPVDG